MSVPSVRKTGNSASAPALPPLADFLRWMTEMPRAFAGEPLESGNPVAVHAVASDLLETYLGETPDESLVAAFRPANSSKVEQNRMRWILAACHLLWHPALRERGAPVAGLRRFLVQELASLAALVPASSMSESEERREELVRRVLRAIGLLLPDESAREAEDRLTQLDSIEHERLIRAAAEKEKRARDVREMMARRAAEEAAAKVSRE